MTNMIQVCGNFYCTRVFCKNTRPDEIVVGAGGGSNLDGQIDGQHMRVQTNSLPEHFLGKVKALSRFSFDCFFGIRSQTSHLIFFDMLKDRIFETLA